MRIRVDPHASVPKLWKDIDKTGFSSNDPPLRPGVSTRRNLIGEQRMAGMGGWDRQLVWRLVPGLLLSLAMVAGARAAADEPAARVVLAERIETAGATRVRIELKAEGLYRPGLPPGGAATAAQMPKPRSIQIQTRLVFDERMVEAGQDGTVHLASDRQPPNSGAEPQNGGGSWRAVRQVLQAASAIDGEIRPTAALIRPEMSLLVAQRREREGPVVVVSPSGPLTWPELELVQGVGDPLALADLLPSQSIVVGDRWKVASAAAQAVSGYDTITSNELVATLESTAATKARIRLKGKIEGKAFGGPGIIIFEGFLTFDPQKARIDQLDLNRVETRQAGPVEAGLDLKSTLTVSRVATEPSALLSDKALARLSVEISPQRELLLMTGPGGTSTLFHDRHWHRFWSDPKLIVLKRLEGGQVIAQCNLMAAPPAGAGRHQDPAQFRDDIRRGLKDRFVQFLGAGEVDGNPAGGFRYKVGVQGRERDFGVVWYYYLVASPAGDQLLATFTLLEDHVKIFGGQDLDMIGSLRWLPAAKPATSQ